jgi:hypothetical protein
MDRLTIQRWLDRFAVILWGVALCGYFAPWIARRPMSAALSWNAYDLFDLLRLLPEIESGSLSINLQALRLPLVGLAMILPLLLHRRGPALRWTAGLFGGFLAALTLPPYPQILEAWRTPGWAGVLGWAVAGAALAVSFAPLAPRLQRYRGWIIIAIACVTGIPASATLQRLQPSLSRLHAAPVRAGWGYWMYVVGTVWIVVSVWLQTIRQGAEYEKKRATDAAPSEDQGEIRISAT